MKFCINVLLNMQIRQFKYILIILVLCRLPSASQTSQQKHKVSKQLNSLCCHFSLNEMSNNLKAEYRSSCISFVFRTIYTSDTQHSCHILESEHRVLITDNSRLKFMKIRYDGHWIQYVLVKMGDTGQQF